MKVYCLGDKPRRQASYTMSIAPAADMTKNEEVPSLWVDGENKPVQFNVEFIYGEAEVEDSIGRYLCERGLAKKTKIFLPRLEALPEEDPRMIGAGGQQLHLFSQG